MRLIAIKLDNGAAISDNTALKGYHSSYLSQYLFNGEKPTMTFDSSWFTVSTMPTKCQRVVPEKTVTVGFRLKDDFPETKKTPRKVDAEFFEWSKDERQNNDIFGLYEPITDTIPESYEDEELEVEVIAEVEDFNLLRGFEYQVRNGQWPNSQPGYTITEKNAEHQVIDKMFFPRPLIATRPTKLSSYDSYQIIRNYIKDNINPLYAEITSDYDFCLTVKKRIALDTPESYIVDDNFNPFGRKRKPKMVTKYRDNRQVTVYETAPLKDGTVYRGYTQCPSFEGVNYPDLQKNIKEYLDKVITEINEPLVDCPHCKGRGVVTSQELLKPTEGEE